MPTPPSSRLGWSRGAPSKRPSRSSTEAGARPTGAPAACTTTTRWRSSPTTGSAGAAGEAS
eukprot:7091427-Alexandrium_andersonii.AAC.1